MDINIWSLHFSDTMNLESKCLYLIPEKCSETDNLIQNYETAYKTRAQ